MKPAVLAPDQVISAPGQLEATAIEFDNDQAMKGLRHYVLMGLRLMDVKARLHHGEFIPWLEKYLPHLSRHHLHRAKSIAEGLCEMTGIKFGARAKFECFESTLPPELETIVAGATGYRALLAGIQEFRQDQAEEKAKALCYSEFAKDPELRDEWEPKGLSGELEWTRVLRGMMGQIHTKGKHRAEPDYNELVFKSLTTLSNGLKAWDKLNEDKRRDFVSNFRDLIREMPQELRDALGLMKGGPR